MADYSLFVISLDFKSFAGVEWPETLLQFAESIFVHTAILSWTVQP
jgi:hypothetical protein